MVHFRKFWLWTMVVGIAFIAGAEKAPDNGDAKQGQPPIGFVIHRNQPDYSALADTSATAELADVFHWDVDRPSEGPIGPRDFTIAGDRYQGWLDGLYASDRIACPILDTSVHHTSIPWRAEMAAAAGEGFVGFDAKPWGFASLHSPVFRESVRHYVSQLIEWVREKDVERRIPAYINGAEWFYPGSLDHSPLAFAAFRDWLRGRYPSLDALNAAWGARFVRWDEVQPPRVSLSGEQQVGLQTFTFGGPVHVGWVSGQFPVEATATYEARVRVWPGDTPEGCCNVVLSWHDAAGALVGMEVGAALRGHSPGQVVAVRGVVPENAVKGAVVLKLSAPGEAFFAEPCVLRAGPDRPVLEGLDAVDWSLAQWWGEGAGERTVAYGTPGLAVSALAAEPPFEKAGVALEDWTVFSYEAMADWLNDCARFIKERDPSRLVASYVGFVFGHSSQWDHASTTQRLDISLANSPDIDVNGIQLCIAGSDPTYATFPLDIARKYGKPLWCTDLIDFPYGHYSGFNAIYRGSLAAAQHGLDGFFWYCWTGVPDYSFYQHLREDELSRLIGDTRRAVELLSPLEPVLDVAQLAPIMSFSMADPGGRKGDPLDNGGLYHLLLDMALQPDVWTPYELAREGASALAPYRCVFLPDCPVLPPPAHALLVDYVRQGGVVLASGRLPAADLAGEALNPALPVPDSGETFRTFGKGRVYAPGGRLGRAYWGRVERVQEHGNTPPVFVEVDDPRRTPAQRAHLRALFRRAMHQAGVPAPLRVTGAGGQVHASLYRDPASGETVCFLVHQGAGRLPSTALQVRGVEAGARVRFEADFEKRSEATADAEGRIEVPPFSHACVVRIAK